MLRILHQWVVELRLTGRVLLPGTYIPSLDASHYVTMGVEKNHRLNILFITSFLHHRASSSHPSVTTYQGIGRRC